MFQISKGRMRVRDAGWPGQMLAETGLRLIYSTSKVNLFKRCNLSLELQLRPRGRLRQKSQRDINYKHEPKRDEIKQVS